MNIKINSNLDTSKRAEKKKSKFFKLSSFDYFIGFNRSCTKQFLDEQVWEIENSTTFQEADGKWVQFSR